MKLKQENTMHKAFDKFQQMGERLLAHGLVASLLLVVGCGAPPTSTTTTGTPKTSSSTTTSGTLPKLTAMTLVQFPNPKSEFACSPGTGRCYPYYAKISDIPVCSPMPNTSPPTGAQRLTKEQAAEVSAWAYNCFANPGAAGYSASTMTFLNFLNGMTVPTSNTSDAQTPCPQYPVFGIIDASGQATNPDNFQVTSRYQSCGSLPIGYGIVGSAIASNT